MTDFQYWFRATLFLAAVCPGCTADGASKGLPGTDGGGTAPSLDIVSTETWDLCRLVGPSQQRPGLYGTDLGFSFLHPQGTPPARGTSSPSSGSVVLLFGDTMPSADSVCDYPPIAHDDLQGSLPSARPDVLTSGKPSTDAASACDSLLLPPPEDGGSSPRPIRLFPDAGARSPDRILDTGPGKTPVGGFSDGTHAFAVFYRAATGACDVTSDCPSGMLCTRDPAYTGRPLGECSPPLATTLDPPPAVCRLDAGGAGDCGSHRTCVAGPHGVCRAAEPFRLDTSSGPFVPPWFEEEARRAIAQTLVIATAAWPDRPEDYAIGATYLTSKFVNPAFRTVAHFDPGDPSKNDYRPGTHTLLVWGRATFFVRGGFQALPFLLYQPLEGLVDDAGHVNWDPRYFAGYDDTGDPRWSAHEVDAIPVYGTDFTVGGNADAGGPGTPPVRFTHPEFDLVNQMSVSFVEPLQRWVMFYGGDLPRWLHFDPATNRELPPAYPEPVPGAVHLRSAMHPWGRSVRTAPDREAWTEPEPVLAPDAVASYLGCADTPPTLPGCTSEHDPHHPLNFLLTIDAHTTITESEWPEITRECLEGDPSQDATYRLSGDGTGRLYAADILDAWTADVTGTLPSSSPSGERAAEVYWHVSTWNPYQVVLMKTQIRGRP